MFVVTAPQIPGYTLETLLGRGAFGSVYRALWNEEFVCAVKVLEEGALHSGYLGHVLERLMELPAHPGLLPVYAFDLAGGMPHVSMALLPEKAVALDDLAGQLTPAEAWTLLEQLAEALAWLHANGLVHAGLTGGNVFVTAGEDGKPRALVADAGQAWLGEGVMDRLHDQAPYLPPERWLEPDRVLVDGRAETWDVYAFGVMAWRLINGRWPRATRLFDRVLTSKSEPLRIDAPAFAEWLRAEPPPVWSSRAVAFGSATAREMISRCLATDPAERPQSMQEVAAILRECAAEDELRTRRVPSPFQVVGKPDFLPDADSGDAIPGSDFNLNRLGQGSSGAPGPAHGNGFPNGHWSPPPANGNGHSAASPASVNGRLTTPAGMPEWALAAAPGLDELPRDNAFPPAAPEAPISPADPAPPEADPLPAPWSASPPAPSPNLPPPPVPPAPPAAPAAETAPVAWPAAWLTPSPEPATPPVPPSTSAVPPVNLPAGWSVDPVAGPGARNEAPSSFPPAAVSFPDKPQDWSSALSHPPGHTASVPVVGRPDFAALFSLPQDRSHPGADSPAHPIGNPHQTSGVPEVLFQGAGEPSAATAPTAPTLTAGTDPAPTTVTVSPFPAAPSGAGRRLAVAAAVLAGLGGIGYGLKQQNVAGEAQGKVSGISKELAELRTATVSASERLSALQENQAAAETARLSARRAEWSDAVSEMLKRQPAEASLREAWKAAAAPLTEKFKEAIEAADAQPSLTEGGRTARWKMAELHLALDQPVEALPWLEHVARDLDADSAGGRELDETGQLLKARIGSRRGAILLRTGHALEAAPLLTAASKVFESWLATRPDRREVAREYAENSLLEGQALTERKQTAEARIAYGRVAGLLGKPDAEGFSPDDHFTLTDSLFGLAALNTAEGKWEPALEQHFQAIRVLVDYDQENRKSIPCRQRLADGYFGLGSLLTKNGSHRDASVAFSEAVKLLTELSKEAPTENIYRYKLALTYDEVAILISSAKATPAGAREALDYQNGSVTILRNLNETNTLDNTYRRQLAVSLSLNGSLEEQAGELPTAASRRTEALALLDELLTETTLGENDRATCLAVAGRTWTALAAQQEKAGDKKEAAASLAKALDSWSALAGTDPAAAKEVETLRARLDKLKPAG